MVFSALRFLALWEYFGLNVNISFWPTGFDSMIQLAWKYINLARYLAN